MNTENNIPLSQIILRFLTGFGAGLSGSIVLMLILFAGWSMVGDALSSTAETTNEFGILVGNSNTHPLFVYFILLSTFLGVLASTATYTFLMTLVEDRFVLRTTTLSHVFFGNLVLMIVLLPAYIMASSKTGVAGVTDMVLAHILISGIFTFLVLEILHWSKYFLVNIYALIAGLSFYFFTSTSLSNNTTSLVLLSMPFLFGFLAMSNSLVTALYQWFFHTYGSDVLNIDTRFGADYEDEAQVHRNQK
jgi:MFS family permease